MKTKIVQDGRKCKLVCNLPSRRLYKALPKIVQGGRNAKFFCGSLVVVRCGPQGLSALLTVRSQNRGGLPRGIATFGGKKVAPKTIRMSLFAGTTSGPR